MSEQARIRTWSEGRGTRYTKRRGLVESALRGLYRGGWPAKLWQHVPGATEVMVAHHELQVEGLHLGRLRIGFASDLHLGPTTPWSLLERAMERLNELGADVILLGGDFVFLDADQSTEDRLAGLLSKLPDVPKFAVLGNHDLWTKHHHIERALERAGVEHLLNRSQAIGAPWSDVVICGVDDPWTGSPDGARAVPSDGSIKIGLCHAPDGLTHFQGRGVAVMMCGHTHGGQIALPGGRPILLPPGPYSQKMGSGRFEVDDLTVLVSKGVGATELPIRTYADPEVMCVDLLAPSTQWRRPLG